MTVTVLVLTRDAGPAFRTTLAAVTAQQPPPDEVLIVDSGSRDGTVALARELGARVHEIPPDAFDFGLTRDLGYEMATGDLIANLSQDVVPKGPSWLATLVRPFADPRVAYVSARCEARDPETMFLWQRLGRFYFTREMRRFAARHGTPCSNANSCVRRAAWENLRHGPMPIAEDLLLQKRFRAAGLGIAYIAEATAWHQHAFTLAQVFRRAFNEGMAARRLGVPYGPLAALTDACDPGLWATLARQVRYGRVRTAADWLYPIARPIAVLSGHRFGKRYWR